MNLIAKLKKTIIIQGISVYKILAPSILSSVLLIISLSSVFYIAGDVLIKEKEQEKIGVILLKARDLLSGLKDTETGQRGYLLTGREEYLEPYTSGRDKTEKSLGELYLLLSSMPDLLHKLDDIRELKEKKFEELEQTILLKRDGKVDAAMNIVLTNDGKRYMDRMRTILGSLMDKVRNIRTIYNGIITHRINQMRFSFALLVLILTVNHIWAYVVSVVSLRRSRELADKLEQEAMHDHLTGLPNRRFHMRWLTHAVEQAIRNRTTVSALAIDLDGFKQVNDQCGHDVGDEVLVATVKRFQEVSRNSDFLARLGGDEFALLSAGTDSDEQLLRIANRLIASLAEPMLLCEKKINIGASIGIARFPKDAQTIDNLLNAADQAMYKAKKEGKNRACFFDTTTACDTCAL